MSKVTRLLGIVIILVGSFLSQLAAAAVASGSLENFEWKSGQIIAISERNNDPGTLLFELATASRYGHIGVVLKGEDGAWYVYESNVNERIQGAQRTPLQEFEKTISNDSAGRPEVAVLELDKDLTAAEVANLKKTFDTWIAQKVHYNFDQVRLPGAGKNCSDFVHDGFDAIGRRNIGEIQRYKDLNYKGNSGSLAWDKFAGPIPPIVLGFQVVSPFAIVSSPNVHPVFSNLPMGRYLSEREILNAWGVDKSEALLQNPYLLPLHFFASDKPYAAYPATWRKTPLIEPLPYADEASAKRAALLEKASRGGSERAQALRDISDYFDPRDAAPLLVLLQKNIATYQSDPSEENHDVLGASFLFFTRIVNLYVYAEGGNLHDVGDYLGKDLKEKIAKTFWNFYHSPTYDKFFNRSGPTAPGTDNEEEFTRALGAYANPEIVNELMDKMGDVVGGRGSIQYGAALIDALAQTKEASLLARLKKCSAISPAVHTALQPILEEMAKRIAKKASVEALLKTP